MKNIITQFKSQKGIALIPLILIIFLVVSVPAGIYLVQHPTILKSRAADPNDLKVYDMNDGRGTKLSVNDMKRALATGLRGNFDHFTPMQIYDKYAWFQLSASLHKKVWCSVMSGNLNDPTQLLPTIKPGQGIAIEIAQNPDHNSTEACYYHKVDAENRGPSGNGPQEDKWCIEPADFSKNNGGNPNDSQKGSQCGATAPSTPGTYTVSVYYGGHADEGIREGDASCKDGADRATCTFTVVDGSDNSGGGSSSTIKGYFDQASDTFSGWACDSADNSKPLQIDFYADNPAGSGTPLGSVNADKSSGNAQDSAAIAAQCGNDTHPHRFTLTTPGNLLDNKDHKIYAYSHGATPSEAAVALTNSPQTMTARSGSSGNTVSYRIAENPTDFTETPGPNGWTPYSPAIMVNYTFKDKAPGTKTIWVEFKDSAGKTERRSIQIDVPSSTSGRIPGDADDNRCVNPDDYKIWKEELNGTRTTKCANWTSESSPVVDIDDYAIWYQAWKADTGEGCITPPAGRCLDQR